MTAISRLNDITAIYREDRDDLSLIYRFDARRFERYLADLSAINHGNKARYSMIIACITFAQYCTKGKLIMSNASTCCHFYGRQKAL